ncbi:MAG: hypothetical protein UW63_C0049G0010, partial [Candidatus Uhrbacteria bacterium GW2011_GWF2_44_350]
SLPPTGCKKDIPRLDSKIRNRIKKITEQKIATNPEIFGFPLRSSLKGHRKLRISDWCMVFKIERDKIVIVLIIQH